ncbi:MAG TPA: alpha/beta hydrolase [Spirochaetota bacterium]|mgnify:CR=1 FL=1|nr:alpha/beta hydrolase [Spirochaetota bacterium]
MQKMKISGTEFIAGRWPLDPSLPSLIFIHGAAGSKMFWKEQVQGLADCCNSIAVDLPGHGDHSGSGFDSVDGYADAVEMFIESAGIDLPVVCGLSMGGAIVQKLLLDGKLEYKAGIIVNSGARLKVMPAIFELIQNNYSGYVSSLPVMGASDKCDKAKLGDIIADAEKSRPDISFGDFTACNNFDVSERLSGIKVPLLILTAEEDKLSPVKYGRFLHERIPGSAFITIPGAGHFSPVEKPGEVNEAIREFLKGICPV